MLNFPSQAGDHVKFNFPMAYTTTVLAWSYLLYPDAYEAAGQKDYILDCIKWPLDYLLKCHTGPEELYVQVQLAFPLRLIKLWKSLNPQ